jgi:hypothetical protein
LRAARRCRPRHSGGSCCGGVSCGSDDGGWCGSSKVLGMGAVGTLIGIPGVGGGVGLQIRCHPGDSEVARRGRRPVLGYER